MTPLKKILSLNNKKGELYNSGRSKYQALQTWLIRQVGLKNKFRMCIVAKKTNNISMKKQVRSSRSTSLDPLTSAPENSWEF